MINFTLCLLLAHSFLKFLQVFLKVWVDVGLEEKG